MLFGLVVLIFIAWIFVGSLHVIAEWLFWTVIIVLLLGALAEGIRWIKGRRAVR